jgi:hypothetical protein
MIQRIVKLIYSNINICSENVMQKNIPKNNKLFLGITVTQTFESSNFLWSVFQLFLEPNIRILS